MFGKDRDEYTRQLGHLHPFQSPCAGNMFGKTPPISAPPRAAVVFSFQSPCAGNMFGKRATCGVGLRVPKLVSIPVCGEHVW